MRSNSCRIKCTCSKTELNFKWYRSIQVCVNMWCCNMYELHFGCRYSSFRFLLTKKSLSLFHKLHTELGWIPLEARPGTCTVYTNTGHCTCYMCTPVPCTYCKLGRLCWRRRLQKVNKPNIFNIESFNQKQENFEPENSIHKIFVLYPKTGKFFWTRKLRSQK